MVIDEFPIILGDNVPSDGPPIALDTKPVRRWVIDLDRYECVCPERRRRHELQLSADERTLMLVVDGGITIHSILERAAEARQVRLNREESLKDFKIVQKRRLSRRLKEFISGRALKSIIVAPVRNQSAAMTA